MGFLADARMRLLAARTAGALGSCDMDFQAVIPDTPGLVASCALACNMAVMVHHHPDELFESSAGSPTEIVSSSRSVADFVETGVASTQLERDRTFDRGKVRRQLEVACEHLIAERKD